MSENTIKTIIETNIRQNGQQLITGQVLQNVLKAMVDDSDGKVNQLSQEFKTFGVLVASLLEDAVFVRDRSEDIARLKEMFDDGTFATGLAFPITLM